MLNGTEIMMITTAIESHIGHLRNMSEASNDASLADMLQYDMAEFSLLHGKILSSTSTDGTAVFFE